MKNIDISSLRVGRKEKRVSYRIAISLRFLSSVVIRFLGIRSTCRGTPTTGLGGRGTPVAGLDGRGTPVAGLDGRGAPAAGLFGRGAPAVFGRGAPTTGSFSRWGILTTGSFFLWGNLTMGSSPRRDTLTRSVDRRGTQTHGFAAAGLTFLLTLCSKFPPPEGRGVHFLL